MTQQVDVCIRGAGVVGKTLALLLAQLRLRVALVGHAGPPASDAPEHSDVRAYALNAASRSCLESVRGWPQVHHAATAVTRMEVRGEHGGFLSFAAADVGHACLNSIVDASALQARLTEALHFQTSVVLLDAPPEHAALTVVCEGRRSTTRAEWGFDFDVNPYPHQALAARMRLAQPHQGVARQWFNNGDIAALLPLGGDTAVGGAVGGHAESTDNGRGTAQVSTDGHTVALVWSTDTAKAQRLCAADNREFLAELSAVCGEATEGAAVTHAPQTWGLELSQAQRWTGPGVALAGDAAHALHPLAGQGLNMGLADAAELARVLGSRDYWRSVGDPKLLRRYERARKADFAAMAGVTDGLFGLFNHSNGLAQKWGNWGLNGVNQLPALKNWLTRQAMGLHGSPL
jgi:2-polyprenyl-6-methoxyphenol hydroxylase-like FAD-dependent oxidoreductase